MNILVVTSKAPPEYSGSGNRVLAQYERMQKQKKINYQFVTSSTEKYISLPNKNNILSRCISFKICSYLLPFNKVRKIKILKYLEFIIEFYICYIYLRKIIKKFDIIHIVGDVALTAAAIFIAENNSQKYIYEIVNEDKNKNDPLWIRVPPLFKKPNFHSSLASIKTINRKTKQQVLKLHADTKVYYYPNSVDAETVRCLKQLDQKSFSATKRVINIAKFIPRKKQNLLIEAMSHLSDEYSLVLMGPMSKTGANKLRDDKYLASLVRSIQNLNLSERVTIKVGFVENPLKVLSEYDIFVYPSVDEAFGTTLVEATLMCVPVVASASEPAFKDFVKTGVSGYLFDGTSEDLAQKIEMAADLDKDDLNIFSNGLLNKLSHKNADENLLLMLSETLTA